VTEAEIAAALRSLPASARERVLAPYRVRQKRDEFGLTTRQRMLAKAFNVAKDQGLDAAIAKFPDLAERRATLERALADPHFHTRIRANAAKLRASRALLDARRHSATGHLWESE